MLIFPSRSPNISPLSREGVYRYLESPASNFAPSNYDINPACTSLFRVSLSSEEQEERPLQRSPRDHARVSPASIPSARCGSSLPSSRVAAELIIINRPGRRLYTADAGTNGKYRYALFRRHHRLRLPLRSWMHNLTGNAANAVSFRH